MDGDGPVYHCLYILVLCRRFGNETEKRVRAEYEERGRREEVTIRQGEDHARGGPRGAILVLFPLLHYWLLLSKLHLFPILYCEG